MTEFTIESPVADFTGESAGAYFRDGSATLDVVDDKGRASLGYFMNAGYKITPADADGPSAREVLAASADPAAEARELQREIEQLEARRDVDDLRKRRNALREQLGDVAPASAGELEAGNADESAAPAPSKQDTPAAVDNGPMAPPPGNAGVEAWRTWVVESGRDSEESVSTLSRTEIINTYGAAYDADRAAYLKGEGA
jgi:hypothetical protein